MRRIYSASYESPQRSKQPSIPHPNAGQIRVASVLAFLRWITLIAAGIVGIVALIEKDEWLVVTLVLVGTHVFLIVVFFLVGGGLRCRVCSNPVILSSRSNKSPHAKQFLGLSYPLQVAKDALFTRHFTCMYCGGKIRVSKRRGKR